MAPVATLNLSHVFEGEGIYGKNKPSVDDRF